VWLWWNGFSPWFAGEVRRKRVRHMRGFRRCLPIKGGVVPVCKGSAARHLPNQHGLWLVHQACREGLDGRAQSDWQGQ
jgi:hypothetical protein